MRVMLTTRKGKYLTKAEVRARLMAALKRLHFIGGLESLKLRKSICDRILVSRWFRSRNGEIAGPVVNEAAVMAAAGHFRESDMTKLCRASDCRCSRDASAVAGGVYMS